MHGRLKAAEKLATMVAFKAGDIDLLVATTVIEVGVDVPNASLMVIENAERLGLAQLHQLRGRVGRGSAVSRCVLLYRHRSQMARERLQTMRETNDGFVIAEKDLELRGPGELLGTRQTGLAGFRIADLARDAGLLPGVHDWRSACWTSNPRWLIVWCSAGSAPPCVTPRRKCRGGSLCTAKGSNPISGTHIHARRGSTVEPSPRSAAVGAARGS